MEHEHLINLFVTGLLGAGVGSLVLILISAFTTFDPAARLILGFPVLCGVTALVVGHQTDCLVEACDDDQTNSDTFMGIGAAFTVLGVTDATGTPLLTYAFLFGGILAWGMAAKLAYNDGG